MKNWTFGQQFAVLLVVLVVCNVLSFATRIGWFHNLGWLLYGLLFVVHPVWPRSWDYADHDKLRLGCRPLAAPKTYCPYIYAADVVG